MCRCNATQLESAGQTVFGYSKRDNAITPRAQHYEPGNMYCNCGHCEHMKLVIVGCLNPARHPPCPRIPRDPPFLLTEDHMVLQPFPNLGWQTTTNPQSRLPYQAISRADDMMGGHLPPHAPPPTTMSPAQQVAGEPQLSPRDN